LMPFLLQTPSTHQFWHVSPPKHPPPLSFTLGPLQADHNKKNTADPPHSLVTSPPNPLLPPPTTPPLYLPQLPTSTAPHFTIVNLPSTEPLNTNSHVTSNPTHKHAPLQTTR
jgi:hypothetical protein